MQAISILGHTQGILSHTQKDCLTERDNLFDQCCLSERPWGAVTRQFTWLLHGWGRQVSEITHSTDSLLFHPVSLSGASATQQQGHQCDVVASGVCCLLVFLSKNPEVRPVLSEKVALCNRFSWTYCYTCMQCQFGSCSLSLTLGISIIGPSCYFINSFRVFKWCVHLCLYIRA